MDGASDTSPGVAMAFSIGAAASAASLDSRSGVAMAFSLGAAASPASLDSCSGTPVAFSVGGAASAAPLTPAQASPWHLLLLLLLPLADPGRLRLGCHQRRLQLPLLLLAMEPHFESDPTRQGSQPSNVEPAL